MKVKHLFEVTSNDHFFVVRDGCRMIGYVVYSLEFCKWLFKHHSIVDRVFVGDTRDEAVENYYKFHGGM